MKNEVLEEYKRYLASLDNTTFKMGLPEEKERVRKHIQTLEAKQKGRTWDGDLGCYDNQEEDLYCDI